MKKNELLHVHGLLSEVVSFCDEDDTLDIDLEAYRDMETRPKSISRAKAEHEEAVFALADAVVSAVRDDAERGIGLNPAERDDDARAASSDALR